MVSMTGKSMTSETEASPLVWEQAESVVVLTLNRPDARNALNEAMIGALESAIERLEQSTDVRAVIIASSAGCFCAGADLRMIADHRDAPYRLFRLHDRLIQLAARIERLSVPVIAALNGSAFGGGAELALACDFRIMSTSAMLGFPEVRLGILPGAGGTARLARVVGRERALLLELTGEAISAQESLAMGLILRVVPDGQTLAEARALAAKIAQNAPIAIDFIKRSVRLSTDMPLDAAMDYCQLSALFLSSTNDAQEGIGAFLERRTPRWSGE